MVGNGACILKALRLYQHHLELSGGIDVDHLAVLLGALGMFLSFVVRTEADAVVIVHHLGTIVDVLILIIVFLVKQTLLNAVKQRHTICSFHSGSLTLPGVLCKRMQIIALSIIGFFASDVNNYKSFPSYKFCPETIISS